ncbi:DUF5324 family protein [Streptomyces sp. NPDC020875]|uniref:DUF5324 family protein n=1 Tax=Streptomyces sp. NPDC020875 TaxID=3154898 RepID=UPI0033C2E01C
MTRLESVRAATDTAKESVLHAAEVVAPYADSARDHAAHYAQEARVRIAPRVSGAARATAAQARLQYGAHVAPHVPPKVDAAAHRAAYRARKAARQAADYGKPRIEHAVAAAQPIGEEAVVRSNAALAALRGGVTAGEIQRLVRKHERRARAGRFVRGLAIVGGTAVVAFVAWKWWDRQANPDWLVEPPEATEIPDPGRDPLSSVDGSPEALDPEVRAKQHDADAADAAGETGEAGEENRDGRA